MLLFAILAAVLDGRGTIGRIINKRMISQRNKRVAWTMPKQTKKEQAATTVVGTENWLSIIFHRAVSQGQANSDKPL